MLTWANAVNVGGAICRAAREAGNDKNATTEQNLIVRGTCLHALGIIWSDVFSDKTRKLFGDSKQEFLDQCGWPP